MYSQETKREGETALTAEETFEKVYTAYGPALYRFCLVQLGSPADAEDALQEVFCKRLYRAPDFASPEQERRWLFQVAANQCRDEHRRRGRRDLPLDESLPAPAKEYLGLWEQVAALPAEPERRRRFRPWSVGKKVLLAAVLAAHLSWTIHLSLMGVPERWRTDEPLIPAVWAFITFRGPAYRFDVFRLFFRELFAAASYGWAVKFPWVGWAVGALMLGAIAFILSEKQERGAVCAGVGAALGVAVVFTGSLLFTYLFLFSPSEAVLLASITRYLNTVCVVMISAGAAFAFTALSRRRLPSRLAAVLCVALLAVLSGQPKCLTEAFSQPSLHAAETNHEAYLYRRAALRIRSLGVESPRLFLITAYDSGLAQLRIAYELLPWTLPPHGTMLMTENSESVPGAVGCTWQEWRQQLLDGYDYVYIYCPETQFVREFLPVFEDESQVVVDRMFRVIQTDADAVLRNLPEITADPQPDC